MISRNCFHNLKSFANSSSLKTLGVTDRTTQSISSYVVNSNQKLYMSNEANVGDNSSMKEKIQSRILDQEEAKELTIAKPKEIFETEFPDYFSEGKFINRISYVDFVDEALARLKELGLEKDLNAYKELLKVFPPGKYHPKPWDFGLFNAPQQLCALRVLHQMNLNHVAPDREVEEIVTSRFSKYSSVWVKCVRMNYWTMKFRNIDQNPLPEKLPSKPHQIAKLALLRMLGDQRTTVITKNTSSVPTSIDKTWVVYCQSSEQAAIIDRLDEDTILYIEDCGYTYVDDQYLSYYALKYYVDEEERKKKDTKPEMEFNFNTLKVKFYGKPIQEKLIELEEKHYMDGTYVLALGATGTSSDDSILSWLKIMEQRVPKIGRHRVVFRINRDAPETTVTIPNERHDQRSSA